MSGCLCDCACKCVYAYVFVSNGGGGGEFAKGEMGLVQVELWSLVWKQ